MERNVYFRYVPGMLEKIVWIGGYGMRYPVSEKKCSKCQVCCLVTKDIGGKPLEENKMYYQCIADMEGECEEAARCQG